MKLTRCLVVFLVVALSVTAMLGPLAAAEEKKPRTVITGPDTPSRQKLPDQDVFRPGEKIQLRVTYLGFTAGYITIKVNKTKFKGNKAYKLRVSAKSSGLAYWFYSVRDRFVSYVDAGTNLSLGYNYRQNHGGEKEFNRVRYNHEKGLFFRNGHDTGTMPKYTMDVLSALYFLRSRDLDVGDTYSLPVHVTDEVYHLEIKVEGREKVATSNRGWVDAYRIKPTLKDPQKEKEFREKMKGNENRVRIWISADSLKIPLQIGVPADVGTFWGYLSEYEPGRSNGQ